MKKLLCALLSLALLLSLFSGCAAPASPETPSESPWLPFFRGALWIEEREGPYGEEKPGGGTLIPLRFSRERLSDYETLPRIPYARCSAGIRLDFTTSSSEISFRYSIVEAFYDDVLTEQMEAYVDGVQTEQFPINSFGSKRGEVRLSLPDGSHRVTVYLPNWHGLALSDLSLGADAAPVAPTGKSYLILSDSIGQGLITPQTGKTYINGLMRSLNADYLNLSVGGEGFRPEALDELSYRPDRVLVSLGINDYSFNQQDFKEPRFEQIEENAVAYLEKVKALYPEAELLVLTPFLEIHPALQACIQSACERAGVRVVRGTEYFEQSSDLLQDVVHPNLDGGLLLSERLLPLFKESWS